MLWMWLLGVLTRSQVSCYRYRVKECCDCKQRLPLDQFYLDRSSTDGRTRFCRRCSSIRNRSWREKNRDRRADYMRRYHQARRAGTWRGKEPYFFPKWKYGLSREAFELLLTSQGGVCAICGGTHTGTRYAGKRLCVDHDHVTGAIRGLLCHTCNRVMGLLGDNASRLRAAADYLDRYQRVAPPPGAALRR